MVIFTLLKGKIEMRDITSHKMNGLNDELRICVLDEPGAGNGNHRYAIGWDSNPSSALDSKAAGPLDSNPIFVNFQNGPISEAGVNGISNEALLSIVEDRLKGFQSGPYSCRENALALTHVQDALHWLQHRTRERLQRGVEGTSKV